MTLDVRHVSKIYPSGTVALHDISLFVPAGGCTGLLGRNGAGKTTLTSIIASRVSASSGDALVSGVSVLRDPQEVRRLIAVVPQSNSLDQGLSVLDNLIYHGRYFGMSKSASRAAADCALERLGVADLRDRRPRTLSGGQIQRVTWARALQHDPVLLLLDEPSTGLDVVAQRQTHELVRRLKADGLAVLLTTHDMREAQLLCDEVVIVDQGRAVVTGSPDQISRDLGVGSSVLEMTVSNADAAALAGALVAVRRLDGVVSAYASGTGFDVHLGDDGPTDVGLRVVDEMRRRGIGVAVDAQRPVSLEDSLLVALGEIRGYNEC